jgi:hypothetical protein
MRCCPCCINGPIQVRSLLALLASLYSLCCCPCCTSGPIQVRNLLALLALLLLYQSRINRFFFHLLLLFSLYSRFTKAVSTGG